MRALRDALGYERDGLPLVSSHIQDRVDVVQAAVDRLRDIPGFGRRRDDDTPRSWSLPAPPPDDVTVVHVQYESWGPPLRFVRDDNDRWRDADGIPFEWGKLLTNGTVVEGEPPAPKPVFERGFYRLAQNLDVGRPVQETVPAGTQVAVMQVRGEDCSLWHPGSGSTWSVPLAALAAAGAERVEDHG